MHIHVTDGTSQACKLFSFVAPSPVSCISTCKKCKLTVLIWNLISFESFENWESSFEPGIFQFGVFETLKNNYMTCICFSNTWKRHLRFWHKCYKFHSVNQLTLIQLTAVACYSLTAFPAVRRESKIQCPVEYRYFYKLQLVRKCGQTPSSVFDTCISSRSPKHHHGYDFFPSKLSENDLNVDEMNL